MCAEGCEVQLYLCTRKDLKPLEVSKGIEMKVIVKHKCSICKMRAQENF